MRDTEEKLAVPVPDQSAKQDAGKMDYTMVPPELIKAVAEVRAYGCRKYPNGGKDNWKKVEPERYWQALVRHVMAAWDDYRAVDPESGLRHLWQIACNAAFIIQLEAEHKPVNAEQEPPKAELEAAQTSASDDEPEDEGDEEVVGRMRGGGPEKRECSTPAKSKPCTMPGGT